MKAFQEITEWDGNIPNHVYFLSDDKSKLYAYVRQGTSEVFQFKAPYGFNTRGRKFKEVGNTWGFKVTEEKPADTKPTDKTWEVKGSKGDVYTVSQLGALWTCTCSGYKFRGKCKHVDEIKAIAK